MSVDLTKKSVAELRQIIANHETSHKTGSDSYRAVVDELAGRVTKGLSFDRTVDIIAGAAKRGEFITYKTVADESGVKWNTANVAMAKHLKEVCEHAHRRGWPLLTAVVVSKDHLKDGGMDAATLAGFCKCAASLGYDTSDGTAFLKGQQKAVFAAAKDGFA